jgi:hypothetical protein
MISKFFPGVVFLLKHKKKLKENKNKNRIKAQEEEKDSKKEIFLS